MRPKRWRDLRLGDLFESRQERGAEGLPVLSVTMNDGLVDREVLDRKQDSTLAADEHRLVLEGDIAYNTMRMWQGAFGLAKHAGLVSPAYVVLKPKPDVSSAYFSQLFRTRRMLHQFWAYSHGLTDDRLRLYFEGFAAIRVHVPPIAEQTRIASALECWDEAIDVAKKLSQTRAKELALLREVFVRSSLSYQTVPLSTVAEVRTGLAKGKDQGSDAVKVPYLRVANVQDGQLDLSEIKQIEVSPGLISRYALQVGDVLMTEGGDADKLGRGTVWSGEIEPCLHQNHVFAVRSTRDRALPGFIAALAASEYGRSYFLACAKRSTNLASINSTQLRAFPIPLPPLTVQADIELSMATAVKALRASEKLVSQLVAERNSLADALLSGMRRLGPKPSSPVLS